MIRMRQTTTNEILMNTGIKQGDRLSLMLFNLIMGNINEDIQSTNIGYSTGTELLQILCYADGGERRQPAQTAFQM